MARMPDLEKFAARHGVTIVSVADLIQFRLMRERLVRRVSETEIVVPPSGRAAKAYAYEPVGAGGSFLAVVVGEIDPGKPVLVRAHTGTILQDVMGARRSALAITVPETFRAFDAAGGGVLLYLPPRDSLAVELDASARPDAQAVLREIGLGAQVLADVGVRKLRLLTNNPRKVPGLEGHGLELVEHVPLDAVLGPPKAVAKLR
jgi:3,4-dihydroxy 2-butanone 4-phosphate synthase/GTP cyclohydrolase II